MKIKDAYGDITIHTRKNSPSDKLVVKEIFKENVYQLRDDMLDGGVVLDIGANIGVFTIEILRRAKHNGKPVTIYAIEPEPNNLKMLYKNLAANEHLIEDSIVHVVPLAIGNIATMVKITNEHGGSRVVSLAGSGTEIQQITLDEFIATQGITDIAILKADVEGSEVPIILSTSQANLDKVHYWCIEFDEQNGLGEFVQVMLKLGGTCSFHTLGVPARGCYIYAERHIA